jgi:PAS domain S-box-containing protein
MNSQLFQFLDLLDYEAFVFDRDNGLFVYKNKKMIFSFDNNSNQIISEVYKILADAKHRDLNNSIHIRFFPELNKVYQIILSSVIEKNNFIIVQLKEIRQNDIKELIEHVEPNAHFKNLKLESLHENLSVVGLRSYIDEARTVKVISRNCVNLFEYFPHQIINNLEISFIDLIHPEDRKVLLSKLESEFSIGKQIQLEYRILTKSGLQKYVLEKGVFNEIEEEKFLDSTLFDVSERVDFEKKIKESEEKYRLIVENQNELIFKSDHLGRLTYVNLAFCNVFDRNENQLLGKSFRQLIFDNENSFSHIFERISKYPYSAYLENIVNTKTGNKWFSWSFRAVLDSDNQLKHIIGVGRDISERKLIEMELLKAKEIAEENDRFKTIFLNNLSYEIRNPLNAIIGFSELLSSNSGDAKDKSNYLNHLKSSCFSLSKIVDDIINISILESGQLYLRLEKFDINELIDNLHSNFVSNSKKKNLTLISEKNFENKTYIFSDKARIEQIFSYLIENAIKFTDEGEVRFGYKISNNSILCYVKDTGKGIEPEMTEKIFERFVTGKLQSEKGGIGLGLSIAKGFVEALGGKICVESKPGKGTNFFFDIPAKTNLISEADNLDYEALTFKGKNILIAEDEKVNFILFNTILSKKGANVFHARTGTEVVELVKNKKYNFDLIIMDIKMPELNGIECLKIIKTIDSEIPVIACTAYAHANDEKNLLQEGFDEYISKPINRKELLYLIQKRIR